jgi:hypothetical protein
MTERPATWQETYFLAWFSLPVLIVYAIAQAAVGLVIAREQPELRLVIEPYLLLLGLILHVQWRRVSRHFFRSGVPRPLWIAAADCLSFVITFWALGILIQAFLQEAKLI